MGEFHLRILPQNSGQSSGLIVSTVPLQCSSTEYEPKQFDV